MIIVLLGVFVLLIGGGIGLLLVYGTGRPSGSAASAPSTSPPIRPTATFSPPAVPGVTPSSPPDDPTTPPPEKSSRAFDPQPGQCLKNTGSYSKPRLSFASCTHGHYRIVDRIENTTNIGRCGSTGYTYAVWFTDPEYVLCMRGL